MHATDLASAPWTALAELDMAAGRPSEAARALEKALALDPHDVTALTLSAEPLRLLGRSSEARRRNALALEVDRTNPVALERHFAMEARRAGGRLTPEDSSWRAVERLARTRASALSLLAFVRFCNGDLAGVGEMVSFVAKRPRLQGARLEHARLQDAIGRPLAALQEIDAGRALPPRNRELDLLACRVALRAGLPGRSLQECETLLTRYGDAWDTASTAAWVLAHFGRADRAVELSEIAVARQPALPAAWLDHGRVLARCKRLREAISALETGLSLIPEGDGFDLAAPAALELALLHKRLGYFEQAHL